MEMNFMEKVMTVLKYMISSFMNIEILLIVLLFFTILFLNVKRDNRIVKIASSLVFFIFFIVILIYKHDYVKQCFGSTLKLLLTYFYFPPIGIYIVGIILTTIFLIFNICSDKFKPLVRKINIVMIAVMYVFYLNVIALLITNNINISDKASVYTNNQVLSFIQVGNLLWLMWGVCVFIYILYKTFKEKDETQD